MILKLIKWLSPKRIVSHVMVTMDELFILSDSDLKWLSHNCPPKHKTVIAAKHLLDMRDQEGLSVADSALFNYGRKISE